jgi:hypothetical protein
MTIRPPSEIRRRALSLAFTACAAFWASAFLMAKAEAPPPVPSGSDLQACRDACQALASRLMSALQASLKEGGPTAAISVCRDQAPKIASEVSKEKSCIVRRTSLKTRNPKNSPDPWERRVLEAFQKQVADGKDPAGLEFSEVVREGGAPVLRYMKAITAGGPCLACHGRSLAPEVSAALHAAYPEDRATGYEGGDLRGAFSVRQSLPSVP